VAEIVPDDLRLKSGVSLSQARFALSNFCLTRFGADGQFFADIIDLCTDAARLQEVLDTIRSEVHKRCPERLPELVTCVGEVNATDDGKAAASRAPAPRAKGPSAQSTRAPQPKPVSPGPPRAANTDPLRLEPGVSLAQARFVLSEFCLNYFGARGQPLMDAIGRCMDLAALQTILTRIGTDVRARHPDDLSKLTDCVREINETGSA